MSFRAIESLRFQIIEFLIFLGIGFWWGGGAKKTSRAITAREAKNHSYKLFGAELRVTAIPQIQIKCYRLLYYEKAY